MSQEQNLTATDAEPQIAPENTNSVDTGEASKDKVSNLLMDGVEGKGTSQKGGDTNKEEPIPLPTTVEEYDLEFLPESTINDEMLSNFKAELLKQGMTKAQAQGMASYYEKVAIEGQAAYEKSVIDQSQKWETEVKSDPEIGGDNYQKTLVDATRAMEQFSTDELRKIFTESGYGSNPDVVRMMAKIGSQMGEKSMVFGGSGNGKSDAELLYPTMSKK